jgi:hypothetical protein
VTSVTTIFTYMCISARKRYPYKLVTLGDSWLVCSLLRARWGAYTHIRAKVVTVGRECHQSGRQVSPSVPRFFGDTWRRGEQ